MLMLTQWNRYSGHSGKTDITRSVASSSGISLLLAYFLMCFHSPWYIRIMPNSHRPPDITRQCCLRRSASGGRTAVRNTPTLNALVRRSGRLSSHRHTGHDKMVLSVSCLMYRYELGDCSERIQISNFLSATVWSCRESNSHRRSGRDTDKTVLSCPAWRCEFEVARRLSLRDESALETKQRRLSEPD